MSNPMIPLDASRVPDASRSKVIVIKNMPPFKFDQTKNFLATPSTTSETMFTVKPQLVQQSAPNQQRVIVQPAVPSLTSPPGRIVIRASTGAKPTQPQQQFTTLTSCTNMKVQESQPASVAVQNFTTFRSNSTDMALKSPTLLIQPTATLMKGTQVLVPPGLKPGSTFTFKAAVPQKMKITTVSASPKLIPIRAKPQHPQLVPQTQVTSNNARILNANAAQQWSMAVNYQPPVPALALIQPKPIVKPPVVIAEKVVEPVIAEIQPKPQQQTPEKPKRSASAEERFREVKRIIEGDLDESPEHFEQQTESAAEEERYEVEIEEEDEAESSQSLLLCDEKIDSVSPVTADKIQPETTPTPPEVLNFEPPQAKKSVDDVRKNLSLELTREFDKENIGDDSGSEQKSIMGSEDAEASKTPSTPPSVSEYKPKRTRKPKNPTVIATLGLPYKPPGAAVRKTKVEKKLDLELDFHDPINKIQWDDGIGGLDNCNKLFGFDEFGLIEVLNKKDMKAKLKQLDVREEPQGDFKLRKIAEPKDQFVCSVCNKLGTIRDFYTPECCSESCLAITKRKVNENSKESSPDSGITTPVDERKMMFGGELIPLQQLQHHLLEKHLPQFQRKRMLKTPAAKTIDSKFQWDTYLPSHSVPAPVNLFKNPYPRVPNPFKVGMRLEAIDPENQKLFCVCSVVEKLGYRIKLHFDGFNSVYDFWVNADSPNIFPIGFCSSTSRVLQTPPKWNAKKFDWSEYLDYTNAAGAQKVMFSHMSKVHEEYPFKVGMKLETMHQGNLYAVSIIDVIENRILIEFDGNKNIPCRWMDIYSPYLHPCDFHKTTPDPGCFIPPFEDFNWLQYLRDTGCKKAPVEFLFFRTRSAFDFESGHKLEVVDRANPQLIRPATVLCRNEYKIQILFDGFDFSFAYWCDDDSEDIHPINWCEKTNHPIEFPPGYNKSLPTGLCPTSGCRGIGNASHIDRCFHDNAEECPYTRENWTKLSNQKLPSRVDSKCIKTASVKTNGTQAINNLNHLESVEVTSVDTHDETSSDAGKAPAKRGRKRKSVPETSEDQQQRIKISKPFLENYGPQLNYSFNLWKKNSSVLDRASVEGKFSQNPMKWSKSTVAEFIIKITGDIDLAIKFEEQEIDGEDFISMCQNDLTSLMNVKLGPAVKIYNRILLLREEVMMKFIKV